jgi:hypothetical protein
VSYVLEPSPLWLYRLGRTNVRMAITVPRTSAIRWYEGSGANVAAATTSHPTMRIIRFVSAVHFIATLINGGHVDLRCCHMAYLCRHTDSRKAFQRSHHPTTWQHLLFERAQHRERCPTQSRGPPMFQATFPRSIALRRNCIRYSFQFAPMRPQGTTFATSSLFTI